ncbi:hypothetical protein CRG98_035021, partial [Punica granatum]
MASPRGVVITVPTLVLSLLGAAIFLFFLFFSLSSCNCPAPSAVARSSSPPSCGGLCDSASGSGVSVERVRTSVEDIEWVKDQIRVNGLHMAENVLRKGINPRTRAQQLEDLRNFKGISHYEEPEASNHTALPCPGELLVEEHHSNYGEPWAGGRDVFEFLAEASHLKPESR